MLHDPPVNHGDRILDLTSWNPRGFREGEGIRLLGVPIEKLLAKQVLLNWKKMEKTKTEPLFRKWSKCGKIFTFITPNLLILAKEKHAPSFTADFYDFLTKVIWPRDLPTGGGNFPTRISKRNTCSNDSAGPRKCAFWETRKQPYLAVSKNRGPLFLDTAYLVGKTADHKSKITSHTTSHARMNHMSAHNMFIYHDKLTMLS